MKLLEYNDFTEKLEGNGIDRSDGVRIATESSIYNRLVFHVLNFSIQFFREITASNQLGQKLYLPMTG